MLKRTVLLAAAVAIVASVAYADHVPTDVSPHAAIPADIPELKSGDARFVTNLSVAHGVAGPLGENGTFTRDGRDYLIASSTIYGLHVIDVTDPLRPTVVSDYSTAAGCPSQEAEYGAAHASEAAADPGTIPDLAVEGALGSVSGWENDLSFTPDGKIAIIGTDAPGRCHDPVTGGLELIDLSDLKHPRTLALTRNTGEAHSVTIDPTHPWLAYISTSDENDFIDIVDLRSCLRGVAALDQCRPEIARAVFDPKFMTGLPLDPKDRTKDLVTDGCHDIRFRGDRAYCAAVTSTLILDVSGVLAGDGTLNGTHLDCPLADATRAPGVKVTDCTGWTKGSFVERAAAPVPIRVVGSILHDASKPPTADIQISHQAETIDDGKIMFITDERGGGLGVGPGLNQCTPVRCVRRADGACPGGGLWFYDIRDEQHPRLMQQPDGSPAVFLSKNFVQTYFSCTVHYGQQFGNERLLAFAWYTGGTHLIRYTPDYSTTPAKISFEEVGTYIPSGAWTIQAKALMRNPEQPDEVLIYTADANRGLDVLAVSAPAQPTAVSGPVHAPASRRDGETRVLGLQVGRTLPRTGVSDHVLVGLLSLAVAVVLARRLLEVR